MKLLGIETSCDETAVCIVEAEGGLEAPTFNVLGNALYSQVKIHAEYGGVFPALAKREHAKNLVPLLAQALHETALSEKSSRLNSTDRGPSASTRAVGERGEFDRELLKKMLEREPGLFENLEHFLQTTAKPDIDLITVTSGPGLEPALWVGINFALALGYIWNIPVLPTNHLAGHIFSPLLNHKNHMAFPALALLISGGHTELVLIKDWRTYELLGQTRDDAVGEAFDKVARLLGLPYPGGPQVSKLAAEARAQDITPPFPLPRPMINSNDYDFSFSGLKTSVLYGIKKLSALDEEAKAGIARGFEDAATEVLIAKATKALSAHDVKTFIIGGGVGANTFIKSAFTDLIATSFPETTLLMPEAHLATDNAIMIAMAGYLDFLSGKQPKTEITAEGNLALV